jgi:CelD/BcsL family acetyltransferase involved in cellulose biosynthesis
MEYILHKDFSEIAQPEWNALLKESVSDSPFLRYEYQRAWWEHRGGDEWKRAQLFLIVAREREKLIGVAPFFISEREGRPALLLIGSVEISDYLDLIARKDDHARFVAGLLDFLVSRYRDSWACFDLVNLPDTSPTLAALKAEAAQRNWTYRAEIHHPAPRVTLNCSFDEYLERIEKKQSREIRRKMRRAEKSEHNARWFISDMADPETEMNAFLSLMEQDKNKADFLHEPMRAQMRAIMRVAHENGWLWLAFLEINGQRVAANLNFDYNNKLWGYNAGVDRDFMHLSPGWVLLGYVLQWCCENGRTEFDFMRGDEEYKYKFGALNQYVMRARVACG